MEKLGLSVTQSTHTWSRGITWSTSAKMNRVGLLRAYLSSLSRTIPTQKKQNIQISAVIRIINL